jgi:N-acyl-D-aspartate/D-glutamate deacylase
MMDYVIRNVMAVDGSGKAPFRTDVAIQGKKIAAMGNLAELAARQTIDGKGRYLTPGFLDVHRHGEAAAFRPGYGKAELCQGLTSVINGNCGLSMAPVQGSYRQEILDYLAPVVGDMPAGCDFSTIGEYHQQLRRTKQRIHNGMLVGMGTARGCAAGFRDGALTEEEYRFVWKLLEQGLSEGALGVSLGLGYAPECFYDTAGLIRSLEPLRNSKHIVAVHMRQEGDEVVQALEEMLAVARELKMPMQISHLKAIGKRNWNRCVPVMLEMLRQAREEGVDVTCDVYPYPAGSTQLIHVLPPEFQAGGMDALTQALLDPEKRAVMRRRMETATDFENLSLLVGWENIQATSLRKPENQIYEGKNILEIAAMQDKDPYDAVFDLLASEHCAPSMIDRITHQDDIDRILREPYSCVISDATYPENGLMHPRVFGNIPHLLEEYVQQRKVLRVEEAVHKITALPAARFGLASKGILAPGMDADLCLFDLNNIHQTGTWTQPDRHAAGMDTVFVMGKPALLEGVFTEHFGGEVLEGSR